MLTRLITAGGLARVVHAHLTGTERKSLMAAISQELNAPTKYLGAPTFAYQIGGYIIDRNGVLEGENDEELVGNLFTLHGFEAVTTEYDALTLQEEESRLYKAELCDPESPERMEVFSADDDEDAIPSCVG